MKWTRRKWLQASGVGGAAVVLGACGDDDQPSGDSGLDSTLNVDASSFMLDPAWAADQDVFAHGVASGDPLSDRVMLWTRVSTTESTPTVHWYVSLSPDLSNVVASGETMTNAERDFTVKVDAQLPAAGTTYYYFFRHENALSPVGRTKTLPVGDIDHYRFAVVSCSSLTHGYFYAYQHIAEDNDIDVVLHLGDYIYEYASGKDWSGLGLELRPYEPSHECVKIEDYRMRYAQYRRESQLQEMHRQHPMIAIWDDHEFANNAYKLGAENHESDDEGPWLERRQAAAKAYFEWMPIRMQEDDIRIYRGFEIGNLINLSMLDTRIWGRDKQDQMKVDDEGRTLLGLDQESWLENRLSNSDEQWKIIGQQIMVGQVKLLNGLYKLDDAWDGYVPARERFLSLLEQHQNTVVLTGDLHSSWANELSRDPFDENIYSKESKKGVVASEFVCPSVTSPGIRLLNNEVVEELRGEHPHVAFAEVETRGFMVLDIDQNRVHNDFYHLDNPNKVGGDAKRFARGFSVKHGQQGLHEEATQLAIRTEQRPAPAPTEYPGS